MRASPLHRLSSRKRKAGRNLRAEDLTHHIKLRRQTAIRPLDSRPLIIGICGGTGSGKTTITARIIEALSEANVIVLEQDNYYKDYPGMPFEERVKQNFDHPDSMDTPLLAEHVRRLREGQAIERPTYEDGLTARRPSLANTSLLNIDLEDRDLNPLLESLR